MEVELVFLDGKWVVREVESGRVVGRWADKMIAVRVESGMNTRRA